jgi:hypothetical protein
MFDDGRKPLTRLVRFGNFLHGSYDSVDGWKSRRGYDMPSFMASGQSATHASQCTSAGLGVSFANFGGPPIETPQTQLEEGYEWVTHARLFGLSKYYSVRATKQFGDNGWPYKSPDGTVWHMMATLDNTLVKIYAIELAPTMANPIVHGQFVGQFSFPYFSVSDFDYLYDAITPASEVSATFDPRDGATAMIHRFAERTPGELRQYCVDAALAAVEIKLSGGNRKDPLNETQLAIDSTTTVLDCRMPNNSVLYPHQAHVDPTEYATEPTIDFDFPYLHVTNSQAPSGPDPILEYVAMEFKEHETEPDTITASIGEAYYSVLGYGYRSDGLRVEIGFGQSVDYRTTQETYAGSTVERYYVYNYSGSQPPDWRFTGGYDRVSSEATITTTTHETHRQGFFINGKLVGPYAQFDRTGQNVRVPLTDSSPGYTTYTELSYSCNGYYDSYLSGSLHEFRYARRSNWPAIAPAVAYDVTFIRRIGACAWSFVNSSYSNNTPVDTLNGSVAYITTTIDHTCGFDKTDFFVSSAKYDVPIPDPDTGDVVKVRQFYF